MTKEQKFYKALQDVFIGAKIEGKGGFVNLMRIKSNYYRKIEELLKKDIEKALEQYPGFKDELFDKLYSFFSRYFTESGSIYFNSTPFHNNVYEKVYTDEKDVILFWKTQMLYYVKTDRIFRSLPVEFPSYRGVDAEGGQGVLKFYFDASKIENKKANEKRSLVFELDKVKEDQTIVFSVLYSERGTKTKTEDILKAIKKKGIAITEEQLERAFRVFQKQSEVDFFINKNAKAFLQEQFKLWSYQYFWEGAKEWNADRVNELQILKDIAFKIIDFISQFEDELVKIWNKPKFVKNSNYVITLDRIKDVSIIEKILSHKNINEQIKEWQELGIVDDDFEVKDVFEDSPSVKGWQEFPSLRGDKGVFSDGVVKWNDLPYNPKLKERAKELRKAGNLSEVLLWNQIKNKQLLGLDFDRQKIIGNYIVDFYCKNLGVVVEIDGVSHDGKIEYDEKRDDYLKNLGLEIIHISDLDVKKNLEGVIEFLKEELSEHLVSSRHPSIRGENTPSGFACHPSIRGKFRHLPIDTKYFKDLELEILSQFDDLDNALDGWLIKSENYQALNTILPKFKEKVQTIYIDPPFNLDSSDQFLYRTNYKDANWATLLENRLRIARNWLNEKGSIFVRCDYNGNWIVRCLMDEIFDRELVNEIQVNTTQKVFEGVHGYNIATNSLFWYGKTQDIYIFPQRVKREDVYWLECHSGGERRPPERVFFGKTFLPPKGRHWTFVQEKINKMIEKGRIRINEEKNYVDMNGQLIKGMPEYQIAEEKLLSSNWTDIPGYSSTTEFATENSEKLLNRVVRTSSENGNIVMDFFLGSGTTTAVAHKLGRKWIGVEMGEHFYSVVLPRMKKVLAYDKSGISKEVKEYQGGGFFKYYELEQYEEALANCKYEDGDLFYSSLIKGWTAEGGTGYLPGRSPYQEYVFLKDEKMLKALEIDYENNKVRVDLSKLYPNIDIAETLSNLTGKWIKKVTPCPSDTPLQEGNTLSAGADTPLKEGNYEVEFEDGTKINTKDLDYKLIKPLIWWE